MADQVTVKSADGSAFQAYRAVPATGSGPVVVLLQEIFGVNQHIRDLADFYAEEGYVVLAPDLFHQFGPDIELGYDQHEQAFAYYQKFDVDTAVADITATVALARNLSEARGRDGRPAVAALGFCLGGKLAYLAAARSGVDCAVSYYGVGIEQSLDLAPSITCPMVLHFGGRDPYVPTEAVEQIRAAFTGRATGRADVAIYVYPDAGHAFNRPGEHFNKPAAMMAHTRTLALFRRVMGPNYDLSALWDKHTEYEFGLRDVDRTMTTMVAEPYVNHVPTMTGGVGYRDLHRFYLNHFVHSNPADTKLIPVSRTVGTDRVVDEMLFCFTHDREIDWMLPGIPPTGRYVEVPLVAIVNFRGDKLYHEHIYWDQASVLVQIGLLDPAHMPAVAGRATAQKLIDPSLPSNRLMQRWAESEPK
jgi:carboxymethylenebutenolidase